MKAERKPGRPRTLTELPPLGLLPEDGVPREEPRWRPCLADGHDHKIFTIRAIRLCSQAKRLDVDAFFAGYGLLRLTAGRS